MKFLSRKFLVPVVPFLAALTMCAGLAQAQDPDQKKVSGFYVGALLGLAEGSYSSDVSADVDHEPSGAFYGAQIGWSRPVGSVILGLDGDFSFTSIDGEDTTTVLGYKSDVSHEINYLSTIRGRVGFMAGPVLLYGTAGLAMADIDNAINVSYFGMHVGRDDETSFHTGWTGGVGIDFPITSNITLGAEYLYMDMGEEDVTVNIGGYPLTDKGDLTLNTFRFSVKYFF